MNELNNLDELYARGLVHPRHQTASRSRGRTATRSRTSRRQGQPIGVRWNPFAERDGVGPR